MLNEGISDNIKNIYYAASGSNGLMYLVEKMNDDDDREQYNSFVTVGVPEQTGGEVVPGVPFVPPLDEKMIYGLSISKPSDNNSSREVKL